MSNVLEEITNQYTSFLASLGDMGIVLNIVISLVGIFLIYKGMTSKSTCRDVYLIAVLGILLVILSLVGYIPLFSGTS